MLEILKRYKKKSTIKKLEEKIKGFEKPDFNYLFSIKETKHGEPVLLYWSEDN